MKADCPLCDNLSVNVRRGNAGYRCAPDWLAREVILRKEIRFYLS